MYDAFLEFDGKLGKSDLVDGDYVLFTVHRAENVDNPIRLKNILVGIASSDMKTVFPIHPRTKKMIENYGLKLPQNIEVMPPVEYVDSLKLIKHASAVVTDSGGVQKEAFWCKTPCVTMRENTEWVETVELGVNKIVGADTNKITREIDYAIEHYDEIKKRFTENPFGDGRASEKILEIIKKIMV